MGAEIIALPVRDSDDATAEHDDSLVLSFDRDRELRRGLQPPAYLLSQRPFRLPDARLRRAV